MEYTLKSISQKLNCTRKESRQYCRDVIRTNWLMSKGVSYDQFITNCNQTSIFWLVFSPISIMVLIVITVMFGGG
jgi:hypothetical protein